MRWLQFLAAAIVLNPVWSLAQEAPTYSEAGAWTIAIDTTLGDGCFLYGEFEAGSVFRIGVDRNNAGIYALWGDEKWQSIEYGKEYPIQVYFGDETPWKGDAEGFSFDPPENQPWLKLTIGEDGLSLFMLEFMQEHNVRVHYDDREILNLSLKDSFQAGMQLMKCQESADKWSEDPFRDMPAAGSEDPFR